MNPVLMCGAKAILKNENNLYSKNFHTNASLYVDKDNKYNVDYLAPR